MVRSVKLIPLVLALFLAGCATTLPITAPTPDLVLAQAQVRRAGSLEVTFPAGRYVAGYRTDQATFYRSQAALHAQRLGALNPDSGIAVTKDGGHAFFTAGSPKFWILDRPLELAP